jgi:hypothetical protein
VITPGGKVLLVEPPLHVSGAAFEKTLGYARNAGFIVVEGSKILLSKSRILDMI